MENMNKSFIIRNKNVIGMDVQRVYTSTPVGVIQAFSGTTIPRGFLLCNGASYKTTDYPELFDIIGYTYGGSDGTFNVPNLCDGRFLEGSDTSGEYVEAGLPNIEGKWIADSVYTPYFEGTLTGAFSREQDGQGVRKWGSNDGNGMNVFKFDASKSNEIYGASDTVQPKSLRVLYIIKAFHTNEGTDEGVSDDVVDYVEGEIAEVESKIKGSITHSFNTQDGKVKYLKLKLGINTISVVDIYGGKIEILGGNNSVANPDYKTAKVVRHSYGDWSSYDATQVPSVISTKIGNLYYYPTDSYYYLQLNNYANFTVTGVLTEPELVASLPVATSEMILIPESKFTTRSDLLAQTANRQVKTFDNTSSSTEKWYKICSAITGGIGCNIKLTASRADSTATVQYFSALFRDSRYRYTSSYISRERTVYESMLIAEYSAYIIADANNDIWVHVPSYGKAIIEIDTRAITIDGTVGTPVKDYVYSSFEHQYDGRINDSATDTSSTWSGSMISSQIKNAVAIKYDNLIGANATYDTKFSLEQRESHIYGRLLQLDGHLGQSTATFSFLLFIKANYSNPEAVYATQLAGMDGAGTNLNYSTYFELGVSSDNTLTIKNKSAVTASYRFI